MKTKITYFLAGSLTIIIVFVIASFIEDIREEHRGKQSLLDTTQSDNERQYAKEWLDGADIDYFETKALKSITLTDKDGRSHYIILNPVTASRSMIHLAENSEKTHIDSIIIHGTDAREFELFDRDHDGYFEMSRFTNNPTASSFLVVEDKDFDGLPDLHKIKKDGQTEFFIFIDGIRYPAKLENQRSFIETEGGFHEVEWSDGGYRLKG